MIRRMFGLIGGIVRSLTMRFDALQSERAARRFLTSTPVSGLCIMTIDTFCDLVMDFWQFPRKPAKVYGRTARVCHAPVMRKPSAYVDKHPICGPRLDRPLREHAARTARMAISGLFLRLFPVNPAIVHAMRSKARAHRQGSGRSLPLPIKRSGRPPGISPRSGVGRDWMPSMVHIPRGDCAGPQRRLPELDRSVSVERRFATRGRCSRSRAADASVDRGVALLGSGAAQDVDDEVETKLDYGTRWAGTTGGGARTGSGGAACGVG